MSIKLIAIELYRAQQKVDSLEKEEAAAGLMEQDVVKEKLRVARAELQHLRGMLESRKVSAAPTVHIPKSRGGF